MVVKRRFLCSQCDLVVKEIRMCSACKVMGYCSKECQKAAWKVHKLSCKTLRDVKDPVSRDPVIKLVEKLHNESEILTWIDAIIVHALDLENHPENAKKYVVRLYARCREASQRIRNPYMDRCYHSARTRPRKPPRKREKIRRPPIRARGTYNHLPAVELELQFKEGPQDVRADEMRTHDGRAPWSRDERG
ncbi:hypothetical protein PLICRDRAFT_518142 [Plicaturopsis crispa FD-325 SS-3]|nr:hypothetical protein PLICRDRAFT_518142 [Plicaturopsis crispa FD-325 SS-3]